MEGVQVSDLTSVVRNLMRNPQLATGKPGTACHRPPTHPKSSWHIVEDTENPLTGSLPVHSVMELKLVQCPIAQRYGTGNRARRGKE